LVYAGTPAKKDLLDNIMKAVLQLRLNGLNLRLTVAGVPPSASVRYPSIQSAAPSLVASTIQFSGILSHDASLDLVRGADFSLLLRHDARYAQAGFPTKFVESFTVGTPVISNFTSDLAQHLRDVETGFVCAGPSTEDLMVGLRKAASMSTESHEAMRRACRLHALQTFDYRAFIAPLATFFSSAQI
jgi:glycosyltransferase involved in cell wall biosynthesis